MPVITKNQNRFRKVYPGIRKNSVNQVLYQKKIEAGTIELINGSEGSYTFELGYTLPPSVTATVYDSSPGGDANTNVMITSLSTTSVTIQTSQVITGTVYVQIVEL
jgi:hypothetical protein